MLKDRTTKKWTLDEYHRLAEQGFFNSDDRVEWTDGEIVEMSPVGVRRIIPKLIEKTALLEVRQPLGVGDEEPVPDLTLLKPDPKDYADRDPNAGDALLVIEVSDSPLETDQEVKVPKYAGGIPEVGGVGLSINRVWVYREPKAGSYTQIQAPERGAVLNVQQLPSVSLTVDEVLA